MERIGTVIGIAQERIAKYKLPHADCLERLAHLPALPAV
jgi:hypothetical protein